MAAQGRHVGIVTEQRHHIRRHGIEFAHPRFLDDAVGFGIVHGGAELLQSLQGKVGVLVGADDVVFLLIFRKLALRI